MKAVKIIAIVVCVVGVGVGMFFLVDLVATSGKPAEFSVSEGKVIITGKFGDEIPIEGATVRMVETPITLIKRTGGYSDPNNNIRKGKFTAEGYSGEIYVNLTDKRNSYIEMKKGDKFYCFNLENDEQTLAFYDEITAALA